MGEQGKQTQTENPKTAKNTNQEGRPHQKTRTKTTAEEDDQADGRKANKLREQKNQASKLRKTLQPEPKH